MGKILSSILLILLSAGGMAFGQQLVKVGSMPVTGEIALHAAITKGYFEQEGIKLELRTVFGGAVLIPAIAGGSLHMGNSAYVSAFVARARGFDMIILFPYTTYTRGHDPAAIVVRKDSGIRNAKDLEGKTVAVNSIKGLNWLYAAEWMSKNRADPKNANWVEVPFPNMVSALRTKQIDAACAVEPFISLEVARGGIEVLSHYLSEVDPALELAGLVASEKWVRAHQDLVARFVRALRKGTDYINANPDKWPGLLAKYTRLKPELIPRLIMDEHHYPVNISGLQRSADLALKWGLLKKRLNVKKMVWPTATSK
ncbi:MAG: ABC transporter substrate-binding protein [Dehalococcoidia bacterium]